MNLLFCNHLACLESFLFENLPDGILPVGISSSFSKHQVLLSLVLVTSQLSESHGLDWVCVEWVCSSYLSIQIEGNSLAWELSWDHVVEDSESVSSIGMCGIVEECSNSAVRWASSQVGVWTKGRVLKIIPESVSV